MRQEFVIIGILILLLLVFSQLTQQRSPEEKELKEQACYAAANAGTCDSRLVDLGLILPEECCARYRVCCS